MFTVRYGLRQWKKNKLQTLVLVAGLALFTAFAINLLATAPKLFADREPWMSDKGRFATIGLESHSGHFNPIDKRKLERYRNSPAVEKFMPVAGRTDLTMQDSKGNALTGAKLTYLSQEFINFFKPQLPAVVEDLNEAGAVISHQYWQKKFEQRPIEEISLHFPLNDTRLPVIGVLPKGFELFYGRKLDVLLTERQMSMTYAIRFGEYKPSPERVKMILKELVATSPMYHGIVKLNPGYSPADVTASDEQTPNEEDNSHKVVLMSDKASYSPAVTEGVQFNPKLRQQLLKQWWMVFGLTIGLLVLGLFNLLTSNFSRYLQRQQEFQTRQAVGATSQDIVRQLLSENALMSVLVVLVGSVLGFMLLGQVEEQFKPVTDLSTSINILAAVIVAVAVSVVTTIVGVIPYNVLHRKAQFSRSKSAGPSVIQRTLNSGNMVVQIGLAVLAITCAVSLWSTQQETIEQVPLSTDLQQVAYERELYDHSKAIDMKAFKTQLDNQDFTIAYSEERLVDNNSSGTSVSLEDPNEPDALPMQVMPVSGNFLSFIEAEHLVGDHNPSDVNQVVINYSAANALGFDDPKDAVGQQLFIKNHISHQFEKEQPIIIKGVVVDLPHSSLNQSGQAMVYNLLNHEGLVINRLQLYVEADDKQALLDWLRQYAKSTAPGADIVDAGTLNEQLKKQDSEWFFLSKVVLGLTIVVCALAATSLYQQVVAYLIEQSRRYAVMQAVGAQLSDIIKSISGALVPKALAGLLLGVVSILLINDWFQHEFYAALLSAKHLLISVGIFLMLLLISYLPAVLRQLSRPIQRILHEE